MQSYQTQIQSLIKIHKNTQLTNNLLEGLYHNIVNSGEHRLNLPQKQFWRRRRWKNNKNKKDGVKRYGCIKRSQIQQYTSVDTKESWMAL